MAPIAAELPGLTRDLVKEVPALENSFRVVAYVVNEIAYNGGGNNPGFLYWLAWAAHDVDSALSFSDSQGASARGIAGLSCGSLIGSPAGPLLEALLGTTFGC
jgi:hypothetical protein